MLLLRAFFIACLGVALLDAPPLHAQTGTFTRVVAGGFHSLATRSDGWQFSTGANPHGQFGYASPTSTLVPVGRAGQGWVQLVSSEYQSLGLRADGTLVHMGSAAIGVVPTPAGAAAGSRWTQASAGSYFGMAIRSDGTLWSWGTNLYGQLGDGTTTDRNVLRPVLTPTTAAPGTRWLQVSAGSTHVVAMRSDNTLWAWGKNTSGQLGDSTRFDTQEPVQVNTRAVPPGTVWQQVSAGSMHSIALTTNGQLWSWGNNGYIELGRYGNTIVPGQVITPATAAPNTYWTQLATNYIHNLALRSDGSLWAWGANEYGQLGVNSTFGVAGPTREATNATWTAISAGSFHSLAIRDGAVYAAGGYNTNLNMGQLGDGTRNGSMVFQRISGFVLPSRTAEAPLAWAPVPNPSHGHVRLEGLPATASGTVTDLQGRLVHRWSAGTRELDMRQLAPGLYLLIAQVPGQAPSTHRLQKSE